MDVPLNGSNKQSLVDKYGLTLEKLEPKYVEKCTDVKELEKILRVLRSGEEGHYEHIEKLCESKLHQLAPKSRVLRKESPLISAKDLPAGDNIADELTNWATEMKTKDSVLGNGESMGGDENLPPIRSGRHLKGSTEVAGSQPTDQKKQKKVAPRDYREWDKIISNLDDNEGEDEQTESSQSKDEIPMKKPSRSLTNQIKTDGMSNEMKEVVANKEKDKGNEAFRSGDFMEAIVYYNRSLSVLPLPATYNNRALAYIRVSKWSDAVADCNRVLSEEADNIKAKLRRACAYRSLGKFRQAKDDLDMVLRVEPQNKRAQDILKEVTKELQKLDERKAKGKGNRMVIEETDGESEDEEIEEIVIKAAVETKMSTTAPTNDTKIEEVTNTSVSPVSTPTENGHTTKGRRIVIEEDSEDSEEEGNDVTRTTSEPEDSNMAASSNPHSSSDASSESSPRDEDSKSRKPVTRTNSLLRIIQQKMASAGAADGASDQSVGQSTGHQGDGDSNTDSKQTESGVTSSSTSDSADLLVGDPQTGSNTLSTQQIAPDSSGEDNSTPCATSDVVEESESVTEVVQVIQVPALPASIESLKKQGNALFRSGQYGEAISYYTQALSKLGGDESRAYHTATIYSNRSACHIKTGDCRQAIEDATTALQLVPHNAKALLRRAAAQESLERYKAAYIDYRHVINIDSNASTAYTGANRCEKMLSDQHGRKWRTDIPKIPSCSNLPKYELEGAVSTTSQTTSINSQANNTTSQATPITPQSPVKPVADESQYKKSQTSAENKSEPVVESNEDKFERLKGLGNKMVGKGDYELACTYYTHAIAVYPDRVAPYSNRALCYLKTSNPGLAIKDCNTVLAIEPNHVKALFRRAQANKMLHKYKESLSDLLSLLKLEPNNKPAQKECEGVREAYKKQLQSMKSEPVPKTTAAADKPKSSKQPASTQSTTTPKKPATRVVIEEGSDSEMETPAPTAPPSSQQSQTKSSKARQKKKKQAKKSAAAKVSEVQSTNTVPTLSASPTPYEFTQAWNAMKHITDTEPYAKLLKQIPPNKLASVLSNKLEGEMLEKIITCLDDHFSTDELGDAESYLKSISTVPRFSMVTMFMSANCKSALESLLKKLSPISSHIDKIRLAYGV